MLTWLFDSRRLCLTISTSTYFDGLLVTGLYTSTTVQSSPIPASPAFGFGSLRITGEEPLKTASNGEENEVHSQRALKGSVESKTVLKFLLLKAHPLQSCPPVYIRRPWGHY
ncbi:Reelin [Anabarilius grahami]|uniref:Reelin n=1 Tax=Anabarilius grahami TaxID=495550 RepID=A0A3N0YY28_ANAGA|nr:Reelin [Anabarilius grahami]